MPLFLDGPGAERQKRVSEIVLGGPQNTPREHHVTPAPEDPTRRVFVTGPVDGSFYPARLQYWDNEAEDWADFDPETVCWAVAWDSSALEADTPYGPGTVVGYDDEEERAVFAVATGGGGGGAFGGAFAWHNVDQTVVNSTQTDVEFNTTRFDTDGYRDGLSAGKIFKIPADGYYLVYANIFWNAHTVGSRTVFLRKHSGVTTTVFARECVAAETGGNGTHHSVLGMDSFLANDEISVRVSQTSGGNLIHFSTGSYQNPQAWITKLGGSGGGGGSGTVTSVAMTVPTGMTISGSPITTSGTLALGWTGGDNWIDEVDGGTV